MLRAAKRAALSLVGLVVDRRALYRLNPDVDGPQRTPYLHHVDQLFWSRDLEFDPRGTDVRCGLGKPKLGGMALDPGEEGGSIKIAENCHPFPDVTLTSLRHERSHDLVSWVHSIAPA